MLNIEEGLFAIFVHFELGERNEAGPDFKWRPILETLSF